MAIAGGCEDLHRDYAARVEAPVADVTHRLLRSTSVAQCDSTVRIDSPLGIDAGRGVGLHVVELQLYARGHAGGEPGRT